MPNATHISADVIVLGAGAAGLMCAVEAGKRGRKVVVLDRADSPGKKILISGGGRCNFTNRDASPEDYISSNPHFCKSALKRYTPWDFIDLVEKHGIAYHEKELGQLFCDGSARQILEMLLAEARDAGVEILLNADIKTVVRDEAGGFRVSASRPSNRGAALDIESRCASLVVATGGLSLPKIGATPFGYQLAEQFGIPVVPTRPGLVPLTLQPEEKENYSSISGVSIEAVVSNPRASFRNKVLFTHRGLSGPAILQISSYWLAGEEICIDAMPDADPPRILEQARRDAPNKRLKTLLAEYLPKRFIEVHLSSELAERPIKSLGAPQERTIGERLKRWWVKPGGTEGYRTAEVTLGGVDCMAISSKTFEANDVSGLFYVGEVLDVTGRLGGYNFQWAWASGWAAGQVV